jgi:sec-independent protein translocase protein TatA
MPNLGGPEIIIILIVVMLLFGFKRLPDAARSLGRSMRIFKAEVEEMKQDKPSPASKETVQAQTITPPVQPTPPVSTPPAAQQPVQPAQPQPTPPSTWNDPTAPNA